MNLILLGLPGAGKGTQAKMISQEYKIPHISTGDIFRKLIDKGTPLGKKAEKYIKRGELVPDEDTINLIRKKLAEIENSKGFILDGFPRTLKQARALSEILQEMGKKLNLVIHIKVEEDVLIKRISGRRVCPVCGATYHVEFNPPEKEGTCDKCGSQLVQRTDDIEKTVEIRIKKHAEQLKELKSYYQAQGLLKTVSAEGIEELFNEIKKLIEVHR
jgi:adenylate kinase